MSSQDEDQSLRRLLSRVPGRPERRVRVRRSPGEPVFDGESLRFVVGALLLAFGLQWLRKAILRARAAISRCTTRPRRSRASASRPARRRRPDRRGSTGTRSRSPSMALFEGLEVAFIVVTFGATQGRLGLAVAAAATAGATVVVAGLVVRGPLERVPDNTRSRRFQSTPIASPMRRPLRSWCAWSLPPLSASRCYRLAVPAKERR
jgi:hypothetical protein